MVVLLQKEYTRFSKQQLASRRNSTNVGDNRATLTKITIGKTSIGRTVNGHGCRLESTQGEVENGVLVTKGKW